MRKVIVTLLFCGLAGLASAQVYRSVDEQGNVIYSDRPAPGAEELKGVEVQTVENPPPPAVTAPPAPPQAQPYAQIAITSPAADATLRDNTGTVAVSAALSPGLQTQFGHRAQLQVDGAPHGKPGTRLAWTLANVDRGTHTLRLVIVDAEGRQVAASQGSVFHLHRTIKKKPPPKPVPKPPAKPPPSATASGKS